MKKAHIGARVTFDTNVERLVAAGLIQIRRITGEHDGNEYTVLLPDEVSMASQTSLTSLTSHAQKLVRLVRLESSQTRHSLSPVFQTTSEAPKTSFKTNTEKLDDEASRRLASALSKAERELTGKNSSKPEAWDELAELLITELRIAAARTSSVSSIPAFLTEHLRRRLWKKEKGQIEAEATMQRNASAPKVDASKCPDCGGSNFYYPQGYESGVARCRHEKIGEPD
jgi:hypothetical protein